jgi:predicted nucleotidyltransferase component of viral defense system
MENIKENLKKILRESDAKNISFKRNLAKEYLQNVALDFIYSHKDYGALVFYGGSCLKHCHDLQRLSEDLDFVDLTKKIDIVRLASDLKDYFAKTGDIEVRTAIQKFRIYLKFPILHDLGLAGGDESDLLFLKVEIFSGFDFCKNYKTEIVPIFKYNRSLLIKAFDLPTLMATKIRAIKTTAKVKGRDYFDLIWYLEKKVKPNLDCIENAKDWDDLKAKLIVAIGRADGKSIYTDLEPLIADTNFVKNLNKNLKQILTAQINSL